MHSFTFTGVFIYNLLRSVPLLLLAFYPFLESRRFSKKITFVIFIAILAVWQVLSLGNAYLSKSEIQMAIVEIICLALMTALYAVTFKVQAGKKLFFCFMAVNVGYMLTTASKCLEGFLFAEMAMEKYRWTASVCLLMVSPFILIPVFLFIRWEKKNLTQDIQPVYIWQYCWLVPVTFYLIWSYYFYGSGNQVQWSMSLKNVFFFSVVNFGAFLIYYLILRMIRDYQSYSKLREENHVLSLQLMQYDGLNQRIALARQGRHDLRHHILTMENMVKEENYDALRSYLMEIGEKYQLEGPLNFCSNTTVNGILTYFSEIAECGEIEFKVNIGVPEDVKIAKTDLSILFGNLIENAVEACQRQKTGPRKISVRGQVDGNTFALAIDNTYEAVPEKDRRGRFYSMKHSGAGIGTESVKEIVNRYNGVIQFETRGDLFCVSAMLYLE